MATGITVSPLEIYRGDTFRSQKYAWFNEDLNTVSAEQGEPITPDNINDWIAEGHLTPKDWRNGEIMADVKLEGAGSTLWFTLTDYLEISPLGTYLWFELTAQEVIDLATFTTDPVLRSGLGLDLPVTGQYDLQVCQGGEVLTLWQGQVTLTADITERAPCA